MLTGDKLETATCIAKSSRLVSRNKECYTFAPVTNNTDALVQLNNFRKKQDSALIISGDSLEASIFYFWISTIFSYKYNFLICIFIVDLFAILPNGIFRIGLSQSSSGMLSMLSDSESSSSHFN